MRKDMFKVIVERPRPGSRHLSDQYNGYRKAKTVKLDENFDCVDEFSGKSKIPMKGKYVSERKYFNENLNPLRRFLEKSVGRRWDDVYSEICETLDTNSTIKQHVRQHVPDFITTKVRFGENGEVYDSNRWYSRSPLYAGALYVDPNTNIICVAKKYVPQYIAKREADRKNELENVRHFDKDGNYYVPIKSWRNAGTKEVGFYFKKIDNVWFKFNHVIVDRYESYYEKQDNDLVLVRRLYKTNELVKSTASKKEIRDYGLNKPLP